MNLKVRVTARKTEAEGICSFELAAADGQPLPAFGAGSHVDVLLPNGITRQYSLCNDPAETHRYLIAVLREPSSRGGSQALHDQVQEGTELEISPPRNHFALAHEARRSLLLAGGIGVTPILCMAERLAVTGAAFDLHYCARTPARAAFVDRMKQAPFADRVQFHFDDGEPAQQLDMKALLKAPEAGVHLYVCGPKGFMDAVLATARESGWPEDQIHYEFFGADVAPQDGDAAFDVKLASSGRVIRIAADQTIAVALDEAGVIVPVSCEQGVCGTCLTGVIEGEPDHRDQFLTDDERAAKDQILVCCSRSKSPVLVLDL